MYTLWEMVTSMTIEKLKLPAAVAAYLALGGVLAGTALAFGLVPQFFGGFAHADKLNRLAAQLNAHVAQIATADNQHWANQAADSLLRMDQARCALPSGELRSMYDQLIQSRMQEYASLTGQQYPLPACANL